MKSDSLNGARVIAAGLAALLLFYLALPLIGLGARAVVRPEALNALSTHAVLSALTLSLSTSVLSMGVILLTGAPLAYILARYRFPGRQLLITLVELPIVMPPVVAGLGLLLAFGRRGLLGGALGLLGVSIPFSTLAVIMAQVFVAAPFFVRTAQARFEAIPRDLEEAASIDGANTAQYFRMVVLPLSRNGLAAGLALSWARALSEFGATILFAGSLQGRTQTMPLLVYSALESNLASALWSALILVGLAGLALGVVRWLTLRADGDDALAHLSE